MSALSYREIQLLSFICFYCTSIYNKHVNLLCFVINHHNTLFITQISNIFICYILEHNVSLHASTYTTFRNLLSSTQRKHWKTGLYQGSKYCFEGDCDSDLNRLSSVILMQYTTITNNCQQLTWNWTWRIKYCDCWYHFEKRPGRV